jgi:uncharacterized protein YjbI with pentapeptide repeats
MLWAALHALYNNRNAILQRAVLTRSDLGGADIFGADFTNALLDKTQQIALCKYADGINPVTVSIWLLHNFCHQQMWVCSMAGVELQSSLC